MEDILKTIGVVTARSRLQDGYQAFKDAFCRLYRDGDCVVSIGSPEDENGFAERVCRELGLTLTIHYHEPRFGNRAVFARNSIVAADCDVLIAVHDPGSQSTTDAIIKATRMGKKVIEC
jgi:hypothetical protein